MGRRPRYSVLDVHMNRRFVGQYRSEADGAVSFRYAEEWLAWEHAFPVSRQLLLDGERKSGQGVNAVFENLLPDGDDLRRRIAQRMGAPSDRPYDLLSTIGGDCVGAMQFTPAGTTPEDPFDTRGEARSELEIAERLRNLTHDPLGMRQDAPLRISLAGAQEKTAFLNGEALERGQGEIAEWYEPLGATPTTHIFKRPIGHNGRMDLTGSVENELFCLKLLEAFGIPVAQARRAMFEDEKALVVTRFDRRGHPNVPGAILRLPQEDFLQAMGLPSTRKYEADGGPGIVKCLEFLAGSSEPELDQKNFLKAQLLFWMLGAIDGHAKNFSVFLEPRGYRLTPIYDVISIEPLLKTSSLRKKEIQMAMAFGDRRHYRLDQIHPRHLDQMAKTAGVGTHTRRQAYREVGAATAFALEKVTVQLPNGFPVEVTGPIGDRLRNTSTVLNAYVDAEWSA